jgi:hypothetical protein
MDLIWAKREAIYFCANGWTGSISLIGFEKSELWRKGSMSSDGEHSAASVTIPLVLTPRSIDVLNSRVSGRPGISQSSVDRDIALFL